MTTEAVSMDSTGSAHIELPLEQYKTKLSKFGTTVNGCRRINIASNKDMSLGATYVCGDAGPLYMELLRHATAPDAFLKYLGMRPQRTKMAFIESYKVPSDEILALLLLSIGQQLKHVGVRTVYVQKPKEHFDVWSMKGYTPHTLPGGTMMLRRVW